MLPLQRVIDEVVCKSIPKLESRLLESDKPVIYDKVHPDAMMAIHDAYCTMTITLKERPHEYESTVIEAALLLAAAAVKFIADLGDPRITKRLAAPGALVTIADDEDDKSNDERFDLPWIPLRDLPELGYIDQEKSDRVRQARLTAEAEREDIANGKPVKRVYSKRMKKVNEEKLTLPDKKHLHDLAMKRSAEIAALAGEPTEGHQDQPGSIEVIQVSSDPTDGNEASCEQSETLQQPLLMESLPEVIKIIPYCEPWTFTIIDNVIDDPGYPGV